MILLVVSANRIDFNDTWYLCKLRLDDPVLHFPQGCRCPRFTVGLCGAGNSIHGVHKNLAQTGRDRSHFWLHARRQDTLDGTKSLIDQVTREIEIRALFKHNSDLGQAVA